MRSRNVFTLKSDPFSGPRAPAAADPSFAFLILSKPKTLCLCLSSIYLFSKFENGFLHEILPSILGDMGSKNSVVKQGSIIDLS